MGTNDQVRAVVAFYEDRADERDRLAASALGQLELMDVVGVFGVEGPGCLVTDLDQRWLDPEQREAIFDAARLVETEASIIGASHHTLVVATRRLEAQTVVRARRRGRLLRTRPAATPGHDPSAS